VDKLRQVLTASLRVYQEGPDTREERRHILVDYLNSVPLGATPDHGEIFGLKQGVSIWFAQDPDRVMSQIRSGRTQAVRARALKQTLALLCSVRAPSRYLREDHEALERRTDAYATLLAKEGIIDTDFAARVRATPLVFAKRTATAPRGGRIPPTSKATNRIRIDLQNALAVGGLYDLNRLHLNVESTVDAGLQRDTESLMDEMEDSSFVSAHGLRGEHLLSQGDPRRVIYSVLLCERTPGRNEVRVHADNMRGPFDVNEGMKMSLGSTAKVRTLVHYLEIVEKLYGTVAPMSRQELMEYASGVRDPISTWVCETLSDNPGMPAESLLTRATERVYSASPYEPFYTGGGLHAFVNFDDSDNHRRMTIRDAAAHSTNLVFVRLMRDVVRYHEAQLPYDTGRVLSGADSALRHDMLTQIIEEESRATIARAWREYRGLTPQQSVDRFLDPYNHSRRSLENPLELWTVGALVRNPGWTPEDLFRESADTRRIASEWLLRTHNRRAQDLRLRARFERDAFEAMTPSWRRLGFPFQRLVPSCATAIGSSADRPAALAELMGIILNEGEDRPAQRINRLVFAPGTPYHTALESETPAGRRLLSPEVARVARGVLLGVVEEDGGTARRLKGVFRDADGKPLVLGGKTGTGDNRFDTFGRGGSLIASRVTSRTSAFAFFIGDRYYGVVTASVVGPRAGAYRFTSALPLRFLELLAPSIQKRWRDAPPHPEVALVATDD